MIARPIHPEAALVLQELGGDVSNFTARQLTARIASDADLILTMTKAHRDTVLEIAPRQLHRTYTMTEAAAIASEYGPQHVADLAAFRPHLAADAWSDIPDPLGRSPEFFASLGSQIAGLLLPILELCQRTSAAAAD